MKATAATLGDGGGVDHATLYGQVQPNETPELITKGLSELEEELNKLDGGKKVGWTKANANCPEQVEEDHKLMFLRCEIFCADLAALRLVKYWDMRIKIFGEEQAFKPLTLNGALVGADTGLKIGFMQNTGGRDAGGRAVLFVDPSRLKGYDKSEEQRIALARALWYVVHSVLEDKLTQQLGAVIIGYPRHAKKSYVDVKLMKMNAEAMKGCLPIRLAAFHICQPPWFFYKIVFPVIKLFIGERMRKRIKVHAGTDKAILEKLCGFGLTNDVLPTELGGDKLLNHDAWLQKRRTSLK